MKVIIEDGAIYTGVKEISVQHHAWGDNLWLEFYPGELESQSDATNGLLLDFEDIDKIED